MSEQSNTANPARVFVGIPTKDRPAFVKEAIQSVLNQRFSDFRLVVSDNQSAPEVAKEVREYVQSLGDPRVSYHLQSKDEGEYGQGRFLFGECDEEFFMFLHDDDRLEPAHLEEAVKALDSYSSVGFFTAAQYVFDEASVVSRELTQARNRRIGRAHYSDGRLDDVLDRLLTHGGVFVISGSVFRADSLRRIGLVDEDLWGMHPFEFNVFLRQAESNVSCYYTSKELIGYREHASSQTSQSHGKVARNRTMVVQTIKILSKRRFEGIAEQRRRRILSGCYCKYAYTMLVEGDKQACARYLKRARETAPGSWRVWAHVALAWVCPFLITSVWGRKVEVRLPDMDLANQKSIDLDEVA